MLVDLILSPIEIDEDRSKNRQAKKLKEKLRIRKKCYFFLSEHKNLRGL